VLSPYASYALEKKLAKDPSRFGRGAIEAWPARVGQQRGGAELVHPLLRWASRPNAVMALMVGAMTIHGIVPGPLVMTKNPGSSGE